MKRFFLLFIFLLCFGPLAEARKSPGRHRVRSYFRKDGTFVRSHMRGSGPTLSRSRGSSFGGRTGEFGGFAMESAPPIYRPKPVEIYKYPSTPTLEPSWKRQQRLERSLSLGPEKAAAVKVTSSPLASFSGKCIEVIDGDTIRIDRGRLTETVDLYAVDAPEIAQKMGEESKSALSQVVLNQVVTVFPKYRPNDKVVVGWAFVGKVKVNANQVRLGWGVWHRQSAPGEVAFSAIEAEAKEAKVGVWAR